MKITREIVTAIVIYWGICVVYETHMMMKTNEMTMMITPKYTLHETQALEYNVNYVSRGIKYKNFSNNWMMLEA